MKRAGSPCTPTTRSSLKRLCIINGKVVNTTDFVDNNFEDYDDHYYASRRGRDAWFLDHWGAAEGSKRQHAARITEMWPAVKNRRQVRPRSPIKGRPDKRAKPAPELSLEADEVMLPSTPPPCPPLPVFGAPIVSFTDAAPRVECKPVVEKKFKLETEMTSARVVAAAIGDASGRARVARKGAWAGEEDALLRTAVAKLCTNTVPGRTAKQCRERFVEHLDVSLNHDPIVGAEADLVYYLFGKHGHKWAAICEDVNGWRNTNGYDGVRAVNMVKNFIVNREHMFLVPERVDLCKPLVAKPKEVEKTATPIEFFDGFPTSPLRDADVFEALKDVMDVHAIDQDDYEVGTIDKEWEVLIHGESLATPMLLGERPRSALDILAEVGQVADTAETIAETIAETLPTRRMGGYYEMVNTPPRTCCATRKMSVVLSIGDGTPRRSLFASINKMINTPPFWEEAPAQGKGKTAKTPAEGGRRQHRAATLSEAVTASAKVWVTAVPVAEE
jgi:hypothetical protein